MPALVLVDADNLDVGRTRVVVAALTGDDGALRPGLRLVVAGAPAALARAAWPPEADLRPSVGWQRSDVVLAAAYVASTEPLVLVSGDGDFVHLADRHGGPVLVVAARTSRAARLGDDRSVVDPATDGPLPIRAWLAAVLGPHPG